MKHTPIVFLLILANLLLADPPAAVAPVKADQSTPRGALKLYAMAIKNADPKQLKEVLYTASPTEEQLVAVMQRTAIAAGQLRKVIEAKFGAEAAGKLSMQQPSDEDIAKVDKAVETVDGDNATVTMTDAPGQSVDMKLIKSNGAWKVAVAPMLPPVGEDAAKEAVRGMSNYAEALEATAKDTEAGTFANIKEVNGAIDARKLAGTLPPTTHPATAPARK